MNKRDRKEIEKITEELEALKERIENLADYEQEKVDNMPENLIYSERGEAMQEAADRLYDAAGEFESLAEVLIDIIEQ